MTSSQSASVLCICETWLFALSHSRMPLSMPWAYSAGRGVHLAFAVPAAVPSMEEQLFSRICWLET